MKKLLLSLAICCSVQLLASCAARQEDPAPEADAVRTASGSWQLSPEAAETVALPTAREQADPERQYFILASDSAHITQDASQIWITVRGPLANTCQRHDYFDSVSKGSTLYLTFWGSRPTDSNVVCSEQKVGYDREIHIENSPYTRVSIIQPDGRTQAYSVAAPAITSK